MPGIKHPRPHWYRLGKKTGDVSDGNHEDRHVGLVRGPDGGLHLMNFVDWQYDLKDGRLWISVFEAHDFEFDQVYKRFADLRMDGVRLPVARERYMQFVDYLYEKKLDKALEA